MEFNAYHATVIGILAETKCSSGIFLAAETKKFITDFTPEQYNKAIDELLADREILILMYLPPNSLTTKVLFFPKDTTFQFGLPNQQDKK